MEILESSRIQLLQTLRNLNPYKSGDDHHFCDLVNLVRKSSNILKEVKRPQDMDNTHIISLITRKMTPDDLKVWSRHIYVQEKEPSLANLLAWMEEEMTVRLRSGATIRKSSSSYRHGVHAVGGGNNSHIQDHIKVTMLTRQCRTAQRHNVMFAKTCTMLINALNLNP